MGSNYRGLMIAGQALERWDSRATTATWRVEGARTVEGRERILGGKKAWATREREPISEAMRHGTEHDGLVAHLDFAERRLNEQDPIANPTVILPRISAPKPDDLKPFLNGWNPHGPDGFHR